MNKPDATKIRSTMLDSVAEKAVQELDDTRYNWLRPQPVRRLLVALTYAFVLLSGVSSYFELSLITLFSLVAFLASVLLLRKSTRGITDHPDDVVDERMRQVRGRTYRYAFVGVNVFLSAFLIAYIANQLLAKAGLAVPMTADQLHDLSFTLLFACMALPSALFAWSESEL